MGIHLMNAVIAPVSRPVVIDVAFDSKSDCEYDEVKVPVEVVVWIRAFPFDGAFGASEVSAGLYRSNISPEVNLY